MKEHTRKMKRQNSNANTTAASKAASKKEEFAFYIGIDLGDKNCEVCVFNPAGEHKESFRLAMKTRRVSERLFQYAAPALSASPS